MSYFELCSAGYISECADEFQIQMIDNTLYKPLCTIHDFLDKSMGHSKCHVISEDLGRYARQIILPGIGQDGQEKIKASHILVAGIGGLGCLSSVYLCRAGIGNLSIVDSGIVQLSDLNRQILYTEKDIGEMKVFAAARSLVGMNSEVKINAIAQEIKQENVGELVRRVQIVVDGTDNFRTRLLLNAACWKHGVPYIYGGILGLKGVTSTVIPGQTPCLACILPCKDVSDSPIPVISPIVGLIAAIQVMEVFKLILGLGNLLTGVLLLFDGNEMRFDKFAVKRKEDCTICSRADAD